MIRISSAFTSLARDPFPFLLTVLACHFLQMHSWGWLAYLVAAGFCVSVFEQALRADLAPPPRSKNLPRTAYLGCLGSFGLWVAAVLTIVPLSLIFQPLGWQDYLPLASWDHPVIQSLLTVLMVWITQSMFAALYLACVRVGSHSQASRPLNGLFSFLFRFLASPPLDGSGLRLVLLFLALVACQPLLVNSQQSFIQYASLFFASLYAHCLGQYVRKGHGFEIS
ncbi:hypothetical protein JST97_16380 [bacterium]|nr:hypothetical protein [bacterium]